MREYIRIVAQRIAAHRNHEILSFPDDRHPSVRIVRFIKHGRDAPCSHVVFEIPNSADIPIA